MKTDAEIAAWMDRLAIGELAVRFCDAASRGDWDVFESLWMPDAVWEETAPLEGRAEGARAIRTRTASLTDGVDFFLQICHGVVIDELGPGRARARTSIHGIARAGAQSCINYAIYADELVKADGVWRYAHRLLQNIYVDTRPLPGAPAVSRAELR
jgi:hypothetical protein